MSEIKPELYTKILEGLELKKLYVKNFRGQINLDIIPKVVAVEISSMAGFASKAKDQVEISQKWNIVGKDKNSRSECVSISVTYCLVLHSKEKFTKSFFEIYAKTNLPFNVWPFVREFVNNMTARMNVPPLNLPLLKAPSKKRI